MQGLQPFSVISLITFVVYPKYPFNMLQLTPYSPTCPLNNSMKPFVGALGPRVQGGSMMPTLAAEVAKALLGPWETVLKVCL